MANTYDIKRGSELIATVKAEGRQTKRIMREDIVDLEFTLFDYVEFLIGDTVDVFGERYTLNRLGQPEKLSKNNYLYNLHFEAGYYDLAKAQFLFPDADNNLTICDFSIMGNPDVFLDLIVDNMNRVQPGWSKGVVDSTAYRNLSFSSDNCLGALSRLAEEYNTEFWIQGKTINFSQRGDATGLSFRYGKGKGLKSLIRSSVDDRDLVTRLHVFGSDRNLSPDYRSYSKRLRLPGSQLYIEDAEAVAQYGIIEKTLTIDEVYPHREGTVTAVSTAFIFTDTSLDFDINAQMIAGVTPKVAFTTGELAGYEFEIDAYYHPTRAFTILANKDEKSISIPDPSGLKPAIGDKYVVLDIIMPSSYITAAENELLSKGQEYYDQNKVPHVRYVAPTDPIFLQKNLITVRPGDYVTIADPDMSIDTDIRVTGIIRDLQQEYSYQLELADTISVPEVVRQYSERAEIQRVIDRNRLRDVNRSRQSWRTSEELRKMIFDPDDYFDTENIRPESIETSMVSVGVKSQQFILKGTIFSPNMDGDVNKFGWSSGVLSHYTVEPTIREWTIVSNSLTGLSPAGAYYIYAFCNKSNSSGTIQISATQYKVDEFTGLYCFLIGVLHSVQDGYRGISLTYGATTINGRAIKTGIIYSQDGQTWFDLDTGEFRGKFTFTDGTDVEDRIVNAYDLASAANTTAGQVQNYVDNVLPDQLADIQSQIDGNITTYFYDHIPTLSNAPANSWGTTELRNQHLGDIFYDTDTGYAYRFQLSGGVYSWQQLQDSDITEALAKAAQAQDTADNKRRVFVVQPIPPYDVGDLWTQGPNGDLMRCAVARASGSFQAADWILASKYTDDTAANAAQAAADAAQQDADDANALLADIASDSKITPSEKQQTKLEWDGIVAEKPTYESQADQYAITTEKNAYTSAYNTLSAYITPLLADLTTTSSIIGTTFRNRFSEYYDKRQLLLKAITDGAREIGIAARRYADGAAYLRGKMIYRDADFRKGVNGILFYDNSSGGNVVVTRIASPADSPSTSTHALRIRNTGSATPGIGGWRFSHPSRANAKFIVRFIAKIPVGYSVSFATNSVGSGSSHGWATGNAGTGNWEEYIYYIQCGTSGSFGATAYFYLQGSAGTPSEPLDWFLSYASLFDVTDAELDYKDLADQAAAEAANAQSTADAVADLTDFLTTKISGNVVGTGTMLVGGAGGPNAGVSGVVHAGDQSVRFWAGSDYAGRTTAPFRVQDDGKVFMTGAEVSGVINALSGDIGAFEIDQGDGGALAARDNNGYIVGYNSGHHFYFGPNGIPAGSGFYSTGVIRQTESRFAGSKNVALTVEASGAPDENYALWISKGCIAGLAWKVTIAPSGNYVCTDSDVFVLLQYSNNNIYMPSSPERGKVIVVVKTTDAQITINGNGNSMTHRNGSPYTSKVMEWTETRVFDGTYWRLVSYIT